MKNALNNNNNNNNNINSKILFRNDIKQISSLVALLCFKDIEESIEVIWLMTTEELVAWFIFTLEYDRWWSALQTG